MKTPTLTTRPTKLAEFAPLIEDANCWSFSTWSRDLTPELTIYYDDIAADRRLVYRLRVCSRPGNPRYEVTKLTGYNPDKHEWTNHHGSVGPFYLPDKKGWKAIHERLQAKAREAGRLGLGSHYTHYNR